MQKLVYDAGKMGIHGIVLGASGYSAAELLRLATAHPALEVVALGAERAAGAPLEAVQPHLAGLDLPPLVRTSEALGSEAEVIFSCLPGDASANAQLDGGGRVVIDLSDAHRADPEWVYGLTEFARSALERAAGGRSALERAAGGESALERAAGEENASPANLVANPGCYPTAALLALVPFARAGAIEGPISIDAMSGFSGAGRSKGDAFSLASAHGDVSSYGSTEHRHIGEMERHLKAFSGLETTVSFTPHLVPMSRGLLVTGRATMKSPLDDASALGILKDAYEGEPFVEVIEEWPHTKAVTGSNLAYVSARVDKRAGLLICSAAIDNLGKGAAGQAIQNANIIFGLDETLGLARSGVWP